VNWTLYVGGALLLAVVAALVVWREPVLAFTARSNAFLKDVQAEVRKVSWPGWEDLRNSTVVITIIVILLGILIGLMDWLFSLLLIDFFGRIFG
jgi:preprotein translocase subunit SecE